MSKEQKRIFISYAHEDSIFVKRLEKALIKHKKLRIDYDQKLAPGDSLFEIFDKIKKCNFFLIVLSNHSIKSNWVEKELSIAIIRRLQVGNVTIVPLITDKLEIPPAISDTIYVDFRFNFDEALEKLLKTFELMTPPKSIHLCIEKKEERLKFYQQILDRYDRFLLDGTEITHLSDPKYAEYFAKRVLFFKAAKDIFKFEIEGLEDGTSPDLIIPLKFVNREQEIADIRNAKKTIVQFYGSSGFGKSYVLKNLFHNSSLLSTCCYVYIDFSELENKDLNFNGEGDLIIEKIIQCISPKVKLADFNIFSLANELLKTYENSKKGITDLSLFEPKIYFIFDGLDNTHEDVIKFFIRINGLIDTLIKKFRDLVDPQPTFRLILASRQPAIKNRSWCFDTPIYLSISELNEKAVRNLLLQSIARKYPELIEDRRLKESKIYDLSKKIYSLSNGHPKCVNRLCIKISESLMDEIDYEKLFKKNVIGVILQETLNSFHESIQYLLWCLSPFRRINEDVLSVLSYNKFLLSDGGLRNQFSDQSRLMDQLLKTALFNEDEKKFTYKFEYAVRRILYQWMRYEAVDISKQLNEIACMMYEERIQDFNGLGKQEEAISTISTDWRRIFVQESIYHHILKLEYEKDYNWWLFLEKKIDFYLENLYSRAHKLEVLGRLKELIWDEWEKDEELHEEINRITNDNEARDQIDQIMKNLIKTHDEKWKQFYIKNNI